jgi:hypothetical protein
MWWSTIKVLGYSLTTGGVLQGAKSENVKALIEAGGEYDVPN